MIGNRRFLLQLDLEACRDRQETVNQLRNLERAAAASLGLSLVCTRAHLTLDPTYRSLLFALADAGTKRSPVFSPTATELALLVKGRLWRGAKLAILCKVSLRYEPQEGLCNTASLCLHSHLM